MEIKQSQIIDPMKINENTWEQEFNEWVTNGTSKSTRRAYNRDVAYFWKWVKNNLKQDKSYPATTEQVIQFCLYHIDINSPYPLKLSTLRRYLSSVSIRHSELGLISPSIHPKVKVLLRRARAAKKESPSKKEAITVDILNLLSETCDQSYNGTRDKAILLVGFSAGGRRRSEIINFNYEDLKIVEKGYLLNVKSSKTDQFGDGLVAPIYGHAAVALKCWLVKSGIRKGPLFRGIKPNNTFYDSISARTINLIVKRRIKMIGLNPDHYGAHSLRSGFLTESARQGINISEAMLLSGHKSIKTAQGYCRTNKIENNKASFLY